MIYKEYKPVDALPFLLAYTQATIDKCRTQWTDLPNASMLTVDKRGDVDNYERYPLVIVDTTVAAPVDNEPDYGAGLKMRARFVVGDSDSDRGLEALSELTRGLIRSWRNQLETPEGWASYIEVESSPMFIGHMVTTADIVEYSMIATIVARRR